MIKDEEKTGDGYGHSNLLTPSFSEEGFQKGPRRRGRILKPLERGGMDVMGTFASVNHQVGLESGVSHRIS